MADTRPSIADKRRAFHKLHETGCFVIPNPWDAGSARYLQSLGFKALATTSSGCAWSQGRSDGALSRDMVLAHLQTIVAATDLPVNADFERGFADDAAGVAQSVRLAVETGVAALSIEDSTMRHNRCLNSASRWRGFARRVEPSIRRAGMRYWSGALSAFWCNARIWMKRSAD